LNIPKRHHTKNGDSRCVDWYRLIWVRISQDTLSEVSEFVSRDCRVRERWTSRDALLHSWLLFAEAHEDVTTSHCRLIPQVSARSSARLSLRCSGSMGSRMQGCSSPRWRAAVCSRATPRSTRTFVFWDFFSRTQFVSSLLGELILTTGHTWGQDGAVVQFGTG